LGHPGVILSRLGAILGSLGPSWGYLEAVLGVPEAILGSLGAVLGHLGSVLALSWAMPERPRASQSVPVSGSFFGTPFAPKTLLFARKNQHYEVHFGAQNGVPREPEFSIFSEGAKMVQYFRMGALVLNLFVSFGSKFLHR
jgi:hypothetical protein